MVMYHYRPVQEYECDKIQRALDLLKLLSLVKTGVIKWINI